MRKPNNYNCSNGVCLIALTDRKGHVRAYAKIDQADFRKVFPHRWCLSTNAVIDSNQRRLHHIVLGRNPGRVVDHINGNFLDNRKQNLRFATHQQNCFNKDVAGIFWAKDRKKWRAQICVNQRSIDLGAYDEKAEAIEARRAAEGFYFGAFRRRAEVSAET